MTDPKAIDKARSQQLQQRIDLNRKAKFGLQNAPPELLNIIFLICKRLDLDPLTDITMMHGHPWFTIDGTLRMMRRHEEYAGFKQWPLSKDDKLTGGWQETDIVWATEIRTKSWGDIVQWGKVTRAEIEEGEQKKTPIGQHPVEMAQKRSAQHAIRAAFGHDAAPDESQIEQLLVEEIAMRSTPEEQRRAAKRYDEVYGSEEQLPPPPALPPERVAEVEQALDEQLDEDEADEPDSQAVLLSRAWEVNRQLHEVAARLRLRPRVLSVRATLDEIEQANKELDEQLKARQAPR